MNSGLASVLGVAAKQKGAVRACKVTAPGGGDFRLTKTFNLPLVGWIFSISRVYPPDRWRPRVMAITISLEKSTTGLLGGGCMAPACLAQNSDQSISRVIISCLASWIELNEPLARILPPEGWPAETQLQSRRRIPQVREEG